MEETCELIKNSLSLDESQKAMYLAVFQHLPAEKQEEVHQIFQKEAEERQKLKDEIQMKKSDTNTRFITEMESKYKSERKKAVATDEKHDESDADKLLDDLNTL